MTQHHPRARSMVNGGTRGSGRILTGRGQAKPSPYQQRQMDRLSPVPEGRVRCHACYRDLRPKNDGTLPNHDYCLAAGTTPQPIT